MEIKYWRCINYVISKFERTVHVDYYSGEKNGMTEWKHNLVRSYMKSNKYNYINTTCTEISFHEYTHQEEFYIEEFIYLVDDTFYSLYDILTVASIANHMKLASNEEVEDYLKNNFSNVKIFSSRDFTDKAKDALIKQFENGEDDEASIPFPAGTITDPFGPSFIPCTVTCDSGDIDPSTYSSSAESGEFVTQYYTADTKPE